MKKLLACMLTLAMVVSLFAGCSGNNAPANTQPNESTPASASEGGEGGSGAGSLNGKSLNIFACISQKEEEPDGWQAIADKFTEEYGVTVNYTWKGQWDEIPNNMTAAKLSGEQYDLVHTGVGLVLSSLAPAGICMDLTELIDPIKDRWSEGVLDTTTAGGKIWSMPVTDTGSSCFYVNQDMMDELGIEEFKTYDELVAAAKIIAEEKGIMPMIHQGKDGTQWPIWFFEIYGQVTNSLPLNFDMNLIVTDAADVPVGIAFSPQKVEGGGQGTDGAVIDVSFTITEADMPKMKNARNLRIRLDAYCDEALAGRHLRPARPCIHIV